MEIRELRKTTIAGRNTNSTSRTFKEVIPNSRFLSWLVTLNPTGGLEATGSENITGIIAEPCAMLEDSTRGGE